MKNEKLIKTINENQELSKLVVKMWKDEAKAEEIVKVLASEGIVTTADEVEELFAQMQNSKAKDIGMQPIDEEQLNNLTGGKGNSGNTSEMCRSMYKKGDSCFIDAACEAIFEYPMDTCDVNYECHSLYISYVKC